MKWILLSLGFLAMLAAGCERGLPSYAPPGKTQDKGATNKYSMFTSSKPTFVFADLSSGDAGGDVEEAEVAEESE
jgi:hypothetical protein